MTLCYTMKIALKSLCYFVYNAMTGTMKTTMIITVKLKFKTKHADLILFAVKQTYMIILNGKETDLVLLTLKQTDYLDSEAEGAHYLDGEAD